MLISRYETDEDVAFATFQGGLNHHPITENVQTVSAEERIRAEARLKQEEGLRQKLIEAGAEPLTRELRTARDELAQASSEQSYVVQSIVEPAKTLLEEHGLRTWLYVLPHDGAPGQAVAGLLMPYEWAYQYERLLRDIIPQDGAPAAVPLAVQQWAQVLRMASTL